MNIIASTPDGLENCLAEEIYGLGGSNIKTYKRTVSFECNLSNFYKIHFFSRIAFRFYREIARFHCYDKKSLYEGVRSSFPWLDWLPCDKTFSIQVTGRTSLLRHSHFSALQVKNSIIDLQKSVWGKRSNISLDDPDLVIHLHLYNDQGVLSLQSTLDSLHKRGYRPAMGKAPLKENLASGLMKLTKWDGSKPLIDLMCGSGTLLIEGISQALNMSVPCQQKYLFENWLDFDQRIFLNEKTKANNIFYNKKIAKVIGCEINYDVFNQAYENFSLAGLGDYVELLNINFSKLKYEASEGIIVCNPPYGKKIGNEKDLINLYLEMGEFLKANFSGWEFWLLSGNSIFTKYLKMKSSLKIPVSNGGINCRWIKYEIR